MKVKYEAKDGTLFDSEEECKEYEQRTFLPKEVEDALVILSDFCHYGFKQCYPCPLYDRENCECRLCGEDVIPADYSEILRDFKPSDDAP